jgi:hypothetical protein
MFGILDSREWRDWHVGFHWQLCSLVIMVGLDDKQNFIS